MMRHRSWHQVTLLLPIRFHDLITGQLALLGFEGFQQEEDALLCFAKASKWNRSMERSLQELLSGFKKEFPSCDLVYSRRTIQEKNWNARWERSVGIVEVTPHMIIKPSWKKLRKKDRGKVVLVIDPKMSFGTGHHESTRLCLFLAEEHMKKNCRVLDVGCGTGVLSIAAAKLGARSVTGIDNDEWSVMNSKENVRLNRVDRTVRIAKRDVSNLPAGRYDLVLSNIDLPTNIKAIRSYREKLKPGGTLILSGLLTADLPSMLASLPSAGFVPVEFLEENEWVAVALAGNDAA